MNRQISCALLSMLLLAVPLAYAYDGDLDPSFGSGGKVQVSLGMAIGVGIPGSITAADVAVQADGKIVIAGYYDYLLDASTHFYGWVEGRFNADGSVDTSFGGSGTGFTGHYSGEHVENQALGIQLRPNGKIVVGGTIRDDNTGLVTPVVVQLNADGSNDTTWGNNGAVYFTPPAGTSTRTRAIVLDTVNPSALGVLYLVGQHRDAVGHNNFFYGGISADGHTIVSNRYQASVNPNVSESATSVAVQSGTGNIIVGGYAANTVGEVHCAAISTVINTNAPFVQANLNTGWGSGGATSVTFYMAPHNNDYCDAMTLDPSGYLMLGGHGSTTIGGVSYDSAITALFDNNGHLLQTGGGTSHDMTYAFTYDGHPGNGDFNTINRLLLDGYDTDRPRFMAIGSGFDSIFFPGTTIDFGIGRLVGADGYRGTDPDPTFYGGWSDIRGFSMVDYSVCGNQESCSFTSNDRAQSAAFDARGRLVVVGQTDDPLGGTDIAIARLKPFDGIFKNGFDQPSY